MVKKTNFKKLKKNMNSKLENPFAHVPMLWKKREGKLANSINKTKEMNASICWSKLTKK